MLNFSSAATRPEIYRVPPRLGLEDISKRKAHMGERMIDVIAAGVRSASTALDRIF